MTSPVDTSVKYFDSTMANAPVMNGTVGAMIALLDACLKDGFNSVTLSSLAVASGVATATWSGTHAAVKDTVVLIAGVSGGMTGATDLNGEQKVVAKLSGTTLTFAAPGVANGTATGTITLKMAPLGFSKAFSGTNLAAYKSNDAASTGCYLRIDDTATTSCRVVGYEQMSDINTGTAPFPTSAQMSGGGYWAKSSAANSTANQWSLVGDGRVFYLNIQPGSGAAAGQQIGVNRMFGDAAGLRPGGDSYACVLNYSTQSTNTSMYDGGLGVTGTSAFALAREYTGLGTAIVVPHHIYGNSGTAASGLATTAGTFPAPVDGALLLTKKYLPVSAVVFSPRADLPGVYHMLQSGGWANFRQGDRTPGAGVLAGRNLLVATSGDGAASFTLASSTSNTAVLFYDITGPWR